MRRIAIALSAFFVSALGVPATSNANAIPTLAIGSDTVHVGDVFAIQVSIADVAGLTSFQFDLAFDPTIVTVLSFTDIGTDFETAATAGGGFLTGLNGFTFTGLLSGVGDSISGLTTGNGLTPSGTLLDIEFEALKIGISPLTLSNAFLTDNNNFLSSANGDFLLQNGQVAVVDEPDSLFLFVMCLVAFAVLRRNLAARTEDPFG